MAKRTRTGPSPLDNYEVGNILGQGSFAVVKSVTRKKDGERFAMKLVDMELSDAAEVELERKMLQHIGLHRHIVGLADSFELPGVTAFVVELAEGGEVFDKICKDGPFSEADAADVVRQVALGLAFIHTAGVVHRDLKPENLLLTSKGVVKLADFGLAEWCGPNAKPLTEIAGTAAYMAPEVIAADDGDGPAYNEQCDVFSLGCVLFSLLAGYQAFDPKSDGDWEKTMERVEKNQWSFTAFPERWKAVSNPAKQLIRSLLEPKASKRLTADKVLTQKWVSGEGVAKEPLPGSDVQLKHFYHGRRVWREAAEAATVFAKSPLAAMHAATAGKGKGGGKGKGKASSAKPATSSKSLPPAVLAELKEVFANFDLDGDGSIDAREMRHAIRALGGTPGDAERLIEQFDVDHDGVMSFDEFTALVQPLHDNSAAALHAAFDLFDLDGSGDIDRDELSMMLRKLGFEWQGAHVFAAADTDGDGKVDFTEFIACFDEATKKLGGMKRSNTFKAAKTGIAAAKAMGKGKEKAAPPPAKRARR